MNSILYSAFISLAVKMTVITAFVMLIKTVFKTKLSAKAHCLIWCILGIQLVFCLGSVSIPAKTSIYNAVGSFADDRVSNAVKNVDVRNIIAFVWIGGAAALSAWYGAVFFRYRHKIGSYEKAEDAETLFQLRRVKNALEINADITVRYGENAQMIDSTVIIPKGYSPDEEYQILLHELCHYRSRDNFKLWAALAVVCLNWFNPVIWLAFGKFRSDIEMLCDDRVLKLTDSKKEYARVLVKSAAVRSRFVPGAASVHNGKNEVFKRVKRIAAWKRKKPVWAAAAACACVTVSCLCLTDAVSVAVESTVDISATPQPVKISEIIPVPSATPEPTAEPTAVPSSAPERTARPQKRTAAAPEVQQRQSAAPAAKQPTEAPVAETAEPSAVPQTKPESSEKPTIGEERDAVYSAMGEPESVSSNGSKEVYKLDDGRTAVLQYDGDTLENGYIINEE